MALSTAELQAIAQLAYLDTDAEEMTKLAEEVSSIIDFVQQLNQLDTSQVSPLFHPMDLHQRLRPDAVTEADCRAELAEITPYFQEGLYWVPKVIDSGK